MTRDYSRAGDTELKEIKTLANELGRELAVEEFGIYLTGPGVADDTDLGRTPAEANVRLTRMLDRARHADSLRTKA